MDEIRWNQEGGTLPEMVKDVSEQIGEGGGALLIGGPQWLMSPPEFGGKKVYIKNMGYVDSPCPICKQGKEVFVYMLEDDLCCSCCELCHQYGWLRTKKGE
jgi:hypothetical protein